MTGNSGAPRRRAVLLALGGALLIAPRAFAAGETPKADAILVLKSRRRLYVLSKGNVLKRYCIGLGRQPEGAKLQLGDQRTPEGFYTIDGRNAQSKYHRALHISYPNEEDAIAARRAGVDPGDGIEIHGFPDDFKTADAKGCSADWTDGCIAVPNEAIDELWNMVDDGTLVEIRK